MKRNGIFTVVIFAVTVIVGGLTGCGSSQNSTPATDGTTTSTITTRQYSLIPDYNNDKCFTCSYLDIDFLSCSAYQVKTIKIGDETETGPEALCEELGIAEDECASKTDIELYRSAGTKFSSVGSLLSALDKSGSDLRVVKGFNDQNVFLIDFLDGQVQDFYTWFDIYCQGVQVE